MNCKKKKLWNDVKLVWDDVQEMLLHVLNNKDNLFYLAIPFVDIFQNHTLNHCLKCYFQFYQQTTLVVCFVLKKINNTYNKQFMLPVNIIFTLLRWHHFPDINERSSENLFSIEWTGKQMISMHIAFYFIVLIFIILYYTFYWCISLCFLCVLSTDFIY